MLHKQEQTVKQNVKELDLQEMYKQSSKQVQRVDLNYLTTMYPFIFYVGTSDYLGLNHYTTWTAKYNEGPIGSPLTQYDSNVVIKYYTDQWPSSPTAIWLQVIR